MSNVIQFPERASIRIIEGTTVDTGVPVYLLEYVEGASTSIVGEYFSRVDLAHGIHDWEKDGVRVIEHRC